MLRLVILEFSYFNLPLVPNFKRKFRKIFQDNIKIKSFVQTISPCRERTAVEHVTRIFCRLFKRLYTHWELPTSDTKIALKFTLRGYPKLVYTVRVNGSNEINGIPTITKKRFRLEGGRTLDVNFGCDSDAVSVGSCRDSGALRGDSLDFRDSMGFRRGLWNS